MKNLFLQTLPACLFLASCGTALNAQESDPEGHWKLQGDLLDSSGNNNTASNHGADLSAVGIKGKQGGAVQFDGAGATSKFRIANLWHWEAEISQFRCGCILRRKWMTTRVI